MNDGRDLQYKEFQPQLHDIFRVFLSHKLPRRNVLPERGTEEPDIGQHQYQNRSDPDRQTQVKQGAFGCFGKNEDQGQSEQLTRQVEQRSDCWLLVGVRIVLMIRKMNWKQK